jgi:hypothetical protein
MIIENGFVVFFPLSLSDKLPMARPAGPDL